MLQFDGTPAEQSGAPELREQVSAARDRISELLLVVVGMSGGLGLITNLLVSWVHDGSLSNNEWLALAAASAFTLALALLAFARLRRSTRELDEEIEVAFPLLIPTGTSATPVELIEVAAYTAVTDLGHAAVAKLPPEQSIAFAAATRRIDRGPTTTSTGVTLVSVPAPIEDDPEDEEAPAAPASIVSSDDPVLWFLQLAQVLVASECLDESERLLGPEAIFHRGRWLRRRTPRLRDLTWSEMAATGGSANAFLAVSSLPGVRQRTTIPAPARLALTDVAQELARVKTRRALRRGAQVRSSQEAPLVPLLTLDAGRAGQLTVCGIARVSAHATPRFAQPAAGLTTRVFMRNARDNDLRRRALEEESAAMARVEGGVPKPGTHQPTLDTGHALAGGSDDLASIHARVWRALYRGTRRPRIARVYLAVQGRFLVRLSGRGSVADQALYAWSTALARRIGALDIDVFMARLAARQQRVPQRRY